MAVEREPVTHLTDEQAKLWPSRRSCRASRAACSSCPSRPPNSSCRRCMKARRRPPPANRRGSKPRVSGGAGIGGYEVEVTQLANSAQRTFTFTSPSSEETISIDGQEFQAPGRRERQEARERDQRERHRDRLRGGARRRNARAVEPRDRQHRRRIHQSHRRGSRRKGGNRQGRRRRRIRSRRRQSDLQLEHRHKRDRRRHADARRPHAAGPRDDRRPAPRRQPERRRSPGAGVRQALQLDRRGDPDAAEQQVADAAAHDRRIRHRHAVQRPGTVGSARQRARRDVRTRCRPARRNVESV